MLAFGVLQMEHHGTLFQVNIMHVFHLSSFQWLIKVKNKKYFVTSVEIKLWKLYDYDFKDLGSTIYIIDFS